MIEFANTTMFPELKQLWKECFQDTDDYINFYFHHRFTNNNMLVWLEKNKPVSMLTLLPATLYRENASLSLYYIYAVATLPAFQNRGLSSQLLSYANHMIEEKYKAFSILAPATNSLFSFYEKKGYHSSFSIKIIEWNELQTTLLPVIKIEEIDAKEYKELRDISFSKENYVIWDEIAIEYALEETKFVGGFAIKIKWNETYFIVLGIKQGEILLIRETTIPEYILKPILSSLAKHYHCSSIKVRVPCNNTLEGQLQLFGMSSISLEKESLLPNKKNPILAQSQKKEIQIASLNTPSINHTRMEHPYSYLNLALD